MVLRATEEEVTDRSSMVPLNATTAKTLEPAAFANRQSSAYGAEPVSYMLATGHTRTMKGGPRIVHIFPGKAISDDPFSGNALGICRDDGKINSSTGQVATGP